MQAIALEKHCMVGEILRSDLHKDCLLNVVAQEITQRFCQENKDKWQRQVLSGTQ